MGFYLFVKLLYCINVVAQFFLLNAFLSMEYNVFGFEVLDRIRKGMDISYSVRFPRVTLCDFLIRQMTNVQVSTSLPPSSVNSQISSYRDALLSCPSFLFFFF